jgi:hypothetical protein
LIPATSCGGHGGRSDEGEHGDQDSLALGRDETARLLVNIFELVLYGVWQDPRDMPRSRRLRFFRKPLLASTAAALLLSCLAPPEARGMDQVRSQIGVDAAVAQFGVTGRGVIVAVMDRGVDWKNGDFRNDDGSTRIV